MEEPNLRLLGGKEGYLKTLNTNDHGETPHFEGCDKRQSMGKTRGLFLNFVPNGDPPKSTKVYSINPAFNGLECQKAWDNS